MKQQHAIKDTGIDRMFAIANHTLLILLLVAVLYPLIFILSSSFSSMDAVIGGKVWLWPVNPGLEGYKAVFSQKSVWVGFANSTVYTVFGTVISVAMTVLAAYPMSRKNLVGQNFIMFLFVFTMMFSGGLIPTYLLVKDLGMLDTRWAMLLPGALSVWNMIITRTFFQTSIPSELLEAAQIDGCSDFRFLTSMVLPLSAPILAVNCLFYAVGQWNSFFNALIYLSSPSLFPLQIVLNNILVQNEVDNSMLAHAGDQLARQGLHELLKYSLIVVASLPVLVIYPFVQKHFVKGIMIGSLKG